MNKQLAKVNLVPMAKLKKVLTTMIQRKRIPQKLRTLLKMKMSRTQRRGRRHQMLTKPQLPNFHPLPRMRRKSQFNQSKGLITLF